MHAIVFLKLFYRYLGCEVTTTAPNSFQLVLQSVGDIFLIYSLSFPKNHDFRFFTCSWWCPKNDFCKYLREVVTPYSPKLRFKIHFSRKCLFHLKHHEKLSSDPWWHPYRSYAAEVKILWTRKIHILGHPGGPCRRQGPPGWPKIWIFRIQCIVAPDV